MMKTFLAACAALVTALGAASAEITMAQVDRLIAAKGLAVIDRQPDTVVVRAPTGDQIAIGLLDQLGDGRRSILAFLGIYQNSNFLQPAAFNTWNTLGTFKGFLMEDKAGVMQVNVTIGDLPDTAVFGAWDLFLAETINFRAFLYGGMAIQNSASLVGSGVSAREVHDAGLSRAEVTARDAALTAGLNRSPAASSTDVLTGLTLTDAQRKLFSDDSPVGVNGPRR